MICRSCVKVKVKGHHVKNVIFIDVAYFIRVSRSKVTRFKVKGHIGQVQMRIPKKGRWAHINVKLLHSAPSSPLTIGIIMSENVENYGRPLSFESQNN